MLDQLISLMPLAFFFPWPLAAMHGSLSLLYQYWIHTSLIPPLPKFELIFNSPSLHRIHHVRNSHQLGKNYGAIFSVNYGHSGSLLIVWSCFDRFGTECLGHYVRSHAMANRELSNHPTMALSLLFTVSIHCGQTSTTGADCYCKLKAQLCGRHYMITVQYKWHGIRGLLMHWTPPDATCPKLGQKMNPW